MISGGVFPKGVLIFRAACDLFFLMKMIYGLFILNAQSGEDGVILTPAKPSWPDIWLVFKL